MKQLLILLILTVFYSLNAEAQKEHCFLKIGGYSYPTDSVIKISKSELLQFKGVKFTCTGRETITLTNYNWVVTLKKENSMYKGSLPLSIVDSSAVCKPGFKPETLEQQFTKLQSGDLIFIEPANMPKQYPSKFVIEVL